MKAFLYTYLLVLTCLFISGTICYYLCYAASISIAWSQCVAGLAVLHVATSTVKDMMKIEERYHNRED